MYRWAIQTILLVSFTNIQSIAVTRWDRGMGRGMVYSTLKHVLLAPVNLFFDVTPLGKILGIFQYEINIFREKLFHPLRYCVTPAITFIYYLALMMELGLVETMICLLIFSYLFVYISKPTMTAGLHILRIRDLLNCKAISYFWESLRGANITRAFGM